MTEFVCSDLFGLFLLITKIGKKKKIKYLLYTNIYGEFTANMPREFVEEVLNIFSLNYEFIYLKCHVPVISKRTIFNVWYQRYKSDNYIICPYNTYPAIKTSKRVELIFDPQSFFYKLKQDNKGNYLYRFLRFVYRKFKYSKLSRDFNLIAPHKSFFQYCKNSLPYGNSHFIYSCNKFWETFSNTNYKRTSINLIRKRVIKFKPNYIYLPSAEISDSQFYKLFKIQLNHLEINSKILIKPHPRDTRNYSKLLNKLNLNKRYQILFTHDYKYIRFFPLELILSWLNYEVILFGQCASTNFLNSKLLNIFCYGYPEPTLSEFKEDYEYLHKIYSYNPFNLGKH